MDMPTCSMCGFHINPDRPLRVLDELDSGQVCGTCAVQLLDRGHLTLVLDRPVGVNA